MLREKQVAMQVLTADILFFGYGKLTSCLIDELLKSGHSILCVSDSLGDQKLIQSKQLKSISYKEAMNSTITSTITIFTGRDKYILDKFSSYLLRWLESSNFKTKNSFFLSSASVYRNSSFPLSESKINLEINVGKNEKFILEEFLMALMIKKNANHINLRISNVYGSNLDHGLISSIIKSPEKKVNIKLFNNLFVIRDYVYIDDVVNAILQLMNVHSDFNCFNISTGVGSSILRIIELFSFYGYEFSKDLQVLDATRVKKSSILDCTHLANAVFWKPLNIDEGIKRIINEKNLKYS
jgi:nucleoside-diphosphate-sugar epimerase